MRTPQGSGTKNGKISTIEEGENPAAYDAE
jgi:hypothetical protein